MDCRDVREMADSFLSEELLTETNHEILRHLAGCNACRAEVETRRRVRASLRAAFARAPALQARPELASELRARLRAAGSTRRKTVSRWLGLAAALLLAAVAAPWAARHWGESVDAIASAAVGDHRNCAVKFRLAEIPISLEEAARRYDESFRVLERVPGDDVPLPGGTARVVERHSCIFRGRRFAHVVLRYRGELVSVLVTSNDGPADRAPALDSLPVHEQHIDGLGVASVRTARHTVAVVANFGGQELAQLGEALAVPVARQL